VGAAPRRVRGELMEAEARSRLSPDIRPSARPSAPPAGASACARAGS
jgi:hypothetical protein